MLSPNDIDIVIYHSPCPDGFTSCSIAYMYYKSIDKKVDYIGASHQFINIKRLYEKIKNKNILICDFSFKSEITEEIIKLCKNLLIIDHHISAMKDLENIPEKNKIFNMDHCGAYLTFTYFYQDREPPLFVKYIEDNDIWIKKMYKTQEVTAYISLLEYDFEIYGDLLLQNMEYFEKNIFDKGELLLLQEKKQIENTLKKSTVKMIEFNDIIYFVAICNSTTNINEVGNKMLDKYEFCNFSITYSTNNSQNNISFRSENNRTDVSLIASQCNGGGHRNASGCILYNKNYPGVELGDYNSYKQLYDLNFSIGDKYNLVILNSTQNKIEFARYLLQEKNKNIQESSYLYRKLQKQEKEKENDIIFDFSLVWSFGKDMIFCVLHWKDKNDNIKKMLKKTENLEIIEYKNIAKFGLKMTPFPFEILFQHLLK